MTELTEKELEAILKECPHQPVREYHGCPDCELTRADLLPLIHWGYLAGQKAKRSKGEEK